MKIDYILIDYENVQVKSLSLLGSDSFRIFVFVGKTNTKLHFDLVADIQKFGARAEYVKLEASGPNALDFHIAYYLGKLAVADPDGIFHIISKDKGFDPLVAHLKAQKVHAVRSVSIEAMPCFAPWPSAEIPDPPSSSPAKVSPPVKAKSPTKKPAGELDERIQLVMNNLIARKSGRPKTLKTLLNTIHVCIGKTNKLADAEAVLDRLIERQFISKVGLKVLYQL